MVPTCPQISSVEAVREEIITNSVTAPFFTSTRVGNISGTKFKFDIKSALSIKLFRFTLNRFLGELM